MGDAYSEHIFFKKNIWKAPHVPVGGGQNILEIQTRILLLNLKFTAVRYGCEIGPVPTSGNCTVGLLLLV